MLVVHDPGKGRAAEYYRAALESVPDAGLRSRDGHFRSGREPRFAKYPFIVLTDTR
jgi:hypothetical protein